MGAFDSLVNDIQNRDEGQQPQQQPQGAPFAPVDRGTMGDIGSRLGRGTARLGEATGDMIDTIFQTNTGVQQFFEEVLQKYEFLKPDIGEYLGEEGFVERGIKEGIESAPASLGGSLGGAAIGAGINKTV